MKLGQSSTWVHWIAIFVILMSSLSPMISQAISFNASTTSIDTEICSALGTKISHYIQLDSTKTSNLSSDEHCPYCTLQHVSYIPVAVHTHAFIADQSTIFFSLYDQAPEPLFAWLTQPSRAPPQSLN
jgi:hypothetical protein